MQAESPHRVSRPSRRSFLKGASAGAAAVGIASAARADASGGALSQKEQFLLDRITFGNTPYLRDRMQLLGYTDFLKWQLGMLTPAQLQAYGIADIYTEDTVINDWLGAVAAENADVATLWGYTPADLLSDPDFAQFPGGAVQGQSPQMVMLAAHHSIRQLHWVMTDFLQNVHNTFIAQPFGYIFWMSFLRDVVHQHALGDYRELVKASGKGGSMMLYLGQFESDKDNPNENYARELLELHTVGIDDIGAFTTFAEEDMVAAARVLTGWKTNHAPVPELGDFVFDPDAHDMGSKTLPFLPETYDWIPGPDGFQEGDAMIDDLVEHPLCGLHVTRRMIQWFLGDDMSNYGRVWRRCATRFTQTRGDLRETVFELFREEFFNEIVVGAKEKVRRPLNAFLAMKRATNARINPNSANQWEWLASLYRWGQVPGWWPAPNGYQPQNHKWIGSMNPKIQMLHDVFFGDIGLEITDVDIDAILPDTVSLSQYAQTVNECVLNGHLPSSEVTAIQTYLEQHLPTGEDPKRWAVFLLFVAPSFQYLV